MSFLSKKINRKERVSIKTAKKRKNKVIDTKAKLQKKNGIQNH
jgi:hypothetical protein